MKEGDGKKSIENETIGAFRLVNIPERPARQVKVVETFYLDKNGILWVRAHSRIGGVVKDYKVPHRVKKIQVDPNSQRMMKRI